jgi:hypothetical protein
MFVLRSSLLLGERPSWGRHGMALDAEHGGNGERDLDFWDCRLCRDARLGRQRLLLPRFVPAI